MFVTDQRLNLSKSDPRDNESVRGQIVFSLLSRDGYPVPCPTTERSNVTVLDRWGNIDCPPGWEERDTPQGKFYFINHHAKAIDSPNEEAATNNGIRYFLFPLPHNRTGNSLF